MVDYSYSASGVPTRSGGSRFVCPNDRQLALRAKLKTGWSVKTATLSGAYPGSTCGPRSPPDQPLAPEEQAAIIGVIKRAEQVDLGEQERVGRLIDRLENMRRNALGRNPGQCLLCGEVFGVLGAQKVTCVDCRRMVCHKCSIFDDLMANHGPCPSSRRNNSLCLICAETREIWKKSGAWFFKSIPKYKLPLDGSLGAGGNGINYFPAGSTGVNKTRRFGSSKSNKSSGKGGSSSRGGGAEEDGSSTEDDNGKHPQRRMTWSKMPVPMINPISSYNNRRPSVFPVPGDNNILEISHHSQYELCNNTDNTSLITSIYRKPSSEELLGSRSPINNNTTNEMASSSTSINNDDPTSDTNDCWTWGTSEKLSPGTVSINSSTIGGGNAVSFSSLITTKDSSPDNTITVINKPSENPLGTIELALTYDPITSMLHCSVYRAKNLIPMDINGLSDPFCKLNILPNPKTSSRLRTKTVHKTRNPEFNEHLTFYDITESDLNEKSLHILVVDDDKFGHDFMGETRISLAKLRVQNTVYVAQPLEQLKGGEQRGPLPDPELNQWFDNLWSRGQILLSLCYSTKRRALLVMVCKCINLLPMDNNGFSDPFVKLQLRPDPCHKKHKTSIKWKNLNPIYNEEFAFETRPTELSTQSLYITVWDKDYGKSNDYLGGLVLGGTGSKGLRLKQWLDVIRYPDHRHEAWHNLTEETIE